MAALLLCTACVPSQITSLQQSASFQLSWPTYLPSGLSVVRTARDGRNGTAPLSVSALLRSSQGSNLYIAESPWPMAAAAGADVPGLQDGHLGVQGADTYILTFRSGSLYILMSSTGVARPILLRVAQSLRPLQSGGIP